MNSLDDVLEVLASVRKNRTTASTIMNPALKAVGGEIKDNKNHGGSSRSHCTLNLTLRTVCKETGVAKKVSFVCMDLAGAERQQSNSNDHIDAMSAIMNYWKDPASVKPCSQACIINFELSSLRSAVVNAAENHRKGKVVAAPK